MLLKTAKMENKGNKNNIDYLIDMMQEKGILWLVEGIIPKLPDIAPQIVVNEKENFRKRLQNFKPSKISSEDGTNTRHEPNILDK